MPTFTHNVSCSICGKSLKGLPTQDVVDAYKYEFDGYLDYIDLMHRKCALAKGYKIDPNGHIKGHGPRQGFREAKCSGCNGTGIYKHEGDATKYQCPYCKGSGESPYPVKEDVKRVQGRFQVVDRKGNPVGKPHPSYSAAQKADTHKRKLYDDVAAGKAQTSGEFASAGFPTNEDGCVVTSEMSDTAPAVAKLESFMEHVLHETIVKHGSGYRLVSKKGKNLGDFSSKAAAHKHEGEVEWFKKHKK